MIIQVAIVGYAFRIAHSYVCIYVYMYKKNFTLNSVQRLYVTVYVTKAKS